MIRRTPLLLALLPLLVMLFWLLAGCAASNHQRVAAGGESGSGQKPEGMSVAAKGTIAIGIRHPGDNRYELYVMNANGSNLTRLADGASPAWSPDGKRLVFMSYVTELNTPSAPSFASATPEPIDVPHIFIMNTNGSDQKQLGHRAAVEPAWSPDDTEMAYSIYYSSGTPYKGHVYQYCGIYIMNADGSGVDRELPTGPGTLARAA